MCDVVEIIIWIGIIGLFIASFAGLIIPIIPGIVLLWGGFLLYHFGLDTKGLSVWFWIAMTVFTIVLFVADFVANHYFIQKFGGSKRSQWGAIIGVFVGAFVYPPVGLFVVPFLIVFSIELSYRKTIKGSLLAATGAIAGFLSSAIAKGLLQVVMIIWFVMNILL